MTVDTQAAGRAQALLAQVEELVGVGLPMRLPDGTQLGPADAPFRIVIGEWWALRRMLLPPLDLHAGEVYAEGAIDVQGDMEAALRALATIGDSLPGPLARTKLAAPALRLPAPPRGRHSRRARLHGRRHSKARDRAAIAFHYDLPHEFYRQFLDKELVYSCAYFLDPADKLEDAQARKLDVVCRKLRLAPGQRLLDIGCGWGSLLLHAAEHYGVHGIGVTLSQTQKDAADERIAAAGMTGQVEVRLQDYRDVDGEFDAVCSIGMFEHVGPEYLAEYFAAAHRLTSQGGLFLNHGIALGDPKQNESTRSRNFSSTYVFPDGGLVPAWRAVKEVEQAGFEVLDVEQLRPSYTLTLREWVRRLEANHEAAVAAASETDYRIWRAYMAAAAIGFDRGQLGVIQVLGSKGGQVPLGRRWMLPGDA